MRFTQEEKYEIIRLVETSELGVNRTLQELGIAKRTFYNWYGRYREQGYDGLAPLERNMISQWNKIPPEISTDIVNMALNLPDLSPREIACRFTDDKKYFVSESSVYRILKRRNLITSPTHIVMKARDEFTDKTTAPNEMWQTDFTYFKIIGYGWFYLSTVLDDYSRYIIHWELCSTMKDVDAQRTVQRALEKAKLSKENAPKLLSDNGSSYISKDFASFLEEKGIEHRRGRPKHPQTQGKIERYHRSLKNVIKLENYFMPGDLEMRIAEFIEHYNNKRYHESLKNLTPADVYFKRDQKILRKRADIKRKTMNERRIEHQILKINSIS